MAISRDISGVIRCVWKVMSNSRKHIVFGRGRIDPSHPFYGCLKCSGFDVCCFGYCVKESNVRRVFYEK